VADHSSPAPRYAITELMLTDMKGYAFYEMVCRMAAG